MVSRKVAILVLAGRDLSRHLLFRASERRLCGMAQADPPTPFQRFEDALKRVLSVPKKDVDKAAVREKKAREARRTEQPK